jgi:hypothetical protein
MSADASQTVAVAGRKCDSTLCPVPPELVQVRQPHGFRPRIGLPPCLRDDTTRWCPR